MRIREIPSLIKPVDTHIVIPGSKSITNRALLLSALAQGKSVLTNVLLSDDTEVFFNALQKLGVKIQLDRIAKRCEIYGNGNLFFTNANLHCNEAGTAARFLLALCASSSGVFQFDGGEVLRNRPLLPLITALCHQGAKIESHNKKMPLTVTGCGGLKGGEVTIEGNETSQFISALLMLAPFAKTVLQIQSDNIVSKSYVEMTCKMMSEFGVRVHCLRQNNYSVPIPQVYRARDYVIEPDFSTASYFFAAAAISEGRITIPDIHRNESKQGDRLFLSVLEKMGCKLTENETGLMLEAPKGLQGVSVDMRDYSDTFMTLAAIAPFAKTVTTITNIGHTRLQESDRVRVMREELEKLKIKVEEGADWIKIYPSEPTGGRVNAHHDHRIAMSLAVIGLRVKGISIEGADCVAKTCPEFFDLWEKLYH